MNPFRSRSSPAKNRSQQGAQPPPVPPRDAASDDEVPSTSVRTDRLQVLSRLSSTLSQLKNDVKLPNSLTFQPGATATSPKLAFEANNAPFLAHEDALVKLLTQLDGVQSEGDQVVREQRKKIVRAVEEELARLDEIRKAEFERVQRGDPPVAPVANGRSQEKEKMAPDSRGRTTRSQRDRSGQPIPFGQPSQGAKVKPEQPFSHRVAEQILENEHGKRLNHSRGRGSPHSGSEDWSEHKTQPRESWHDSPSSDRYTKMSRKDDNCNARAPPSPTPPPPKSTSARPPEGSYRAKPESSGSAPFFAALPSKFDQRR